VTLNQIGVITASTFSGTASFRLGIYNDNNGVPGTVLLDSGTVSCTSAITLYNITISQALSVGTVYWLAANCITAATTNTFAGLGLAAANQVPGMPVVSTLNLNNGTSWAYSQSVNATSGFSTASSLSIVSTSIVPIVQVRVQ